MATATKITKVVVETTVVNPTVALDKTNASELIGTLNDLKAAAKSLDAQIKDTQEAIYALMGDATIGTVEGNTRVEIRETTRSGIDSKMLKEIFPEAAEKCATSTTYKSLITK